jgi:hypothetical protein
MTTCQAVCNKIEYYCGIRGFVLVLRRGALFLLKKLTKSAFYFSLIKVLVLLQDLQILLLNLIWNEILADPQAGVAVASLAWHQGDGFDAGNVFHGNIHQVADAHSLPQRAGQGYLAVGDLNVKICLNASR